VDISLETADFEQLAGTIKGYFAKPFYLTTESTESTERRLSFSSSVFSVNSVVYFGFLL